MGISENNRKWLEGIQIHKPTLHEIMERQLRKMNIQHQFMEDNGLSFDELQNLLEHGCQLVTIENNKITLVDPNRKPVSNAKQYLLHMDLGHEPVKYYKQDGDVVVEQKTVKNETVKNETVIDDGNGNPLFKVIDYGRGSINETMEKWLSGIKSNNTKVKYDHYNDDDETGFVFPIVSKCEIVGNGPSPFEACAKSIYELIKTKDVVIIQSIFGFGGSDVPFSLFLKNDHGYITAIWLDADWEYYSIKCDDDDKHVWRPCWDSYFNDNHKRGEYYNLNGGERFCRMMDRVMYEIALEQHTTMDDPSLTPIDFYQYLMRSEPYCEFECTLNNFENELCEYLKTEYMFTLERWLKDNPDRTPEDALGTYEFDEPNEEYDCSYYVIYEHTYKPK